MLSVQINGKVINSMNKDYTHVITKIDAVAEKIYNDFQKTEIPSLNLPTRTKTNIKFNEKFNVWKYGKGITERSAKSLDGAYMLLRTMYMADFIKEMIKLKKSSTLREMYYISEGWDLAKFHSQQESNFLAEGLDKASVNSGVPAKVKRIGSMLGLFFIDRAVMNFDDAKMCDLTVYSAFYKGMLEKGIYLAPSQFEALFVSAAHESDHINKTIAALSWMPMPGL